MASLKKDDKEEVSVDLASLSPENLVDLIQQLENSNHQDLRRRAQKELVARLRAQGFSLQRIADLLTRNVYGVDKKRTIAKEWAHALEVTPVKFMRLIGK